MISRLILGIFCVLHGLVHLLYFGHSARYFELEPGLSWPDGAWLFSKFLDSHAIRLMANVALVIVALGFVVGGAGFIFKQDWSSLLIRSVALFSTIIYVIFWDGRMQNLDGKGGVGILINLAIMAVLLWIFH